MALQSLKDQPTITQVGISENSHEACSEDSQWYERHCTKWKFQCLVSLFIINLIVDFFFKKIFLFFF